MANEWIPILTFEPKNSLSLIKKISKIWNSVHSWKLVCAEYFEARYKARSEREALNCIHLAAGIQIKLKQKAKWMKGKWRTAAGKRRVEGKCKNCMRKCHSQRLLNATPRRPKRLPQRDDGDGMHNAKQEALTLMPRWPRGDGPAAAAGVVTGTGAGPREPREPREEGTTIMKCVGQSK